MKFFLGEDKRYTAYVLLFFGSFFLLFSSGRIDSVDPKTQLQAATAWVRTGRLGVKTSPLPGLPNVWVKSASGDYYQAHDIGGVVFMVPSAWLGVMLTPGPVAAQIQEPPWVARFGVAVSYALWNALGAFFVFRLLALVYPHRTAFLLSLAFATTTPFWAYTKSSYDVMGACVGVCLLLSFCGDALRAQKVGWGAASRIGLAFMIACSFRFSLTPFLLTGVLGVLAVLRARSGWRPVLICLAICGAGLVPSLVYNYVRTAAPLQTAATGGDPISSALRNSLVHGLYGLTLSPNRGLLWFAPVFALLVVVPVVWGKLPLLVRQLTVCFGPGALAYVIVIAKMNQWFGVGGWGPRYLVPILPLLFVAPAAALAHGWRKHKRLLGALAVFSATLNAVPVLVNYHLAAWNDPEATNPLARFPAQQAAGWRALLLGLRGRPLPAPAAITDHPLRRLQRNFPDLWTVRLIEYSPAGALVGTTMLVLLAGASAWSLSRLLLRRTD